MSYLEFVELPYSKQLMCCSLAYCRCNKLRAFSPGYWQVYNYIKAPKNKFGRQDMKNIYKWLTEKKEKCQLCELRKKSTEYIASLNETKAKEQNKSLQIEEYGELDIEDFLNG